ncbi:unnamed protein product [Somion occarium]|uniref:F-box domain-containing protein n=1 Tax=Somion occarium TaxID=3059160 RepID=A0ABP1DR67_9APHY
MAYLAVEIQERILDHCAVSKANNSIMYSCTLVCRAWVPRAQYHLFSSVFLNRTNIRLFISAIERKPYLACATKSLHIDPGTDVCSILVPLVGRLGTLEELTICPSLEKTNPALYMVAAQFTSIRKLTIVIHDKIASRRNLIRLICCFPFLEDLSIHFPTGGVLTDNPCSFPKLYYKSIIHLRMFFSRCASFFQALQIFDRMTGCPSTMIGFRELKMVFSSVEDVSHHSKETAHLLSRAGYPLLEVYLSFRREYLIYYTGIH